MKKLIACIFLTVVGLSSLNAKADNYIIAPQSSQYVIQQPVYAQKQVIIVTETPYYYVYVPMPQPVYVQQWYYWQYPYRKVCYRVFNY